MSQKTNNNKPARTTVSFGRFASLAVPQATPLKKVPMLATLIDEPFDDKDWLFEVKWDGYRALAYCLGKDVSLLSRNLKPFTQKYAPVTEALAELSIQAVLDGEIIAVNKAGVTDFQALQNWQNTPVQLQYNMFDVVWLDGHDITQLPLLERKKLLKNLLPAAHPILHFSDHVTGKGKAFFQKALKQGLEGIMAKKAGSTYQFDSRTPEWAKIKVALRQEVVICGYTAPRNSRKFFGSLLLGVYDNNRLVYVGHTGSGFNKRTLEQIYTQLQPLVVSEPPFADAPKTNMPATWVAPHLVCEIKFTEWTKDRIARHAIFMGLREDKKASSVLFEKPTTMAEVKNNSKKETTPPTKKKAVAKAAKTAGKKKEKTLPATRAQLDASVDSEKVVNLQGGEVTFTNLQKIYWPKEKFCKGDLVNYYLQMAPYMLPYLKDRPHSLNRHPNGIAAANFYQKNMRGKLPDWMETFEEFSESTGKPVHYLVCTSEASLLYMANLGCIEINPWHARRQDYKKPDWCLIDLDPDKPNTYDQVVDVAQAVKRILDAAGAASCVKTSGATGMHIYIPLGGKYDFEASKQLAETVVTLVQQEMPDLTSMERTPAKRKGKIYLDFLQNKETQTAAAPYSLRPKPGVPVSAPLHWSEVKHGLTPQTWNAYNMLERVKAEGDLFAPVLQKGIDLKRVMQKLNTFIS